MTAASLAAPPNAAAERLEDGVVPESSRAALRPYLGDYHGQWASELTADVYDDISRYELTDPVLRLGLDDAHRLRLKFFLDETAAAAGEPLDLLGFGCQSRVGDLLELELSGSEGDEAAPRHILEARFDFDWGRCPTRVHAVDANDLELTLTVDPVAHEQVVTLSLLRDVQADSTAYIEADGVRREVKIRPKADSPRSAYNPALEYCVTNAVGEIERCFDRRSKVERFVVPFPFPGLSAIWWTSKSPDVTVEDGVRLIAHKATFRRERPPPE